MLIIPQSVHKCCGARVKAVQDKVIMRAKEGASATIECHYRMDAWQGPKNEENLFTLDEDKNSCDLKVR